MRVMVLVKATKESEAESNPLEMEGAEEMFEQMGKFNDELIKAGIMSPATGSSRAGSASGSTSTGRGGR
jgi:hypothetical protein